MRIALVTPYSWTYEGGVNRHVEALAEELLGRGDDVRVLAPWDPPDRISAAMHHRAPASERRRPEYLVPLGRTVGIKANGAVSNLVPFPDSVLAMRRELRGGGYDVVHVHEPVAPLIAWDAVSLSGTPVVGTFHAYSTKPVPHRIAVAFGVRRKLNQLSARIAVSRAAAWTGQRWFGGAYTIVPNGVDVDAPPSGPKPSSDHLQLLFVGRPDERKGLPVLLRAFEELVRHLPARLTVIGADREDVARYLADPEVADHIDALGRISRAELWERIHGADVLCAPSLDGESFGMVLTEAFAAGTPVIASEIAGYSDVVTDGHDGILVPPADPQRLAEELQALHYDPERLARMGRVARESAHRYAWPRVADQVKDVYEEAIAVPEPRGSAARLARTTGFIPGDGEPPKPAQRLPSLEPPAARSGNRAAQVARRVGLGLAGALGIGLTALAASKIGFDKVIASAVHSNGAWVLIALGLMMSSLFLRAASWYSIACSALPHSPIRRRDVTSATMIGVLMSATLPARLGEPARAVVLARRTGRTRETLPVLLGTLVSQTVLNLVALFLLGATIVLTTELFHSAQKHLFIASLAPLALLVAVILAPVVMRGSGSGRLARVREAVRGALLEVRSGLRVFRDPRRGPVAASAQLTAWGLQLLSCYALALAMGLDGRVGIGACAAVLFAVNVTAVVPATPSNVGVFQLAVISVLTGGFGVAASDALAYGVILQAIEIATAVALGLPALVREGVTWSDMRVRALSTAPVRLSPQPRREREGAHSYGDALAG